MSVNIEGVEFVPNGDAATLGDLLDGKYLLDAHDRLIRLDVCDLEVFDSDANEWHSISHNAVEQPLRATTVLKKTAKPRHGHAAALWGVANPDCVLIDHRGRRVRLKFDDGYWRYFDHAAEQWDLCVGPRVFLDYVPEREEGWGDELG